MTEEERKAIEILKINPKIIGDLDENMFEKMCEFENCSIEELKNWAIETSLNYIDNLEKEIERIKSLDINKLVEDAETGQLVHKDKINRAVEYIEENSFEDTTGVILNLSDDKYWELIKILKGE